MKRKHVKPLWMTPPKIGRPALASKEQFPGKVFAEKGARWLAAEGETNISLPQRKRFARQCFSEAMKKTEFAMFEAQRKQDHEEAHRLKEILVWLKGWKDSIR